MKIGKEKREEILFKNESNGNAKVELKCSDSQADLQFEQSVFNIKPGSEYIAAVKYTPKDAGIFRGIVEVITDTHCL